MRRKSTFAKIQAKWKKLDKVAEFLYLHFLLWKVNTQCNCKYVREQKKDVLWSITTIHYKESNRYMYSLVHAITWISRPFWTIFDGVCWFMIHICSAWVISEFVGRSKQFPKSRDIDVYSSLLGYKLSTNSFSKGSFLLAD